MRNYLIAFAVGLAIGVAAMWYWGDRQYASLKTYADSTRVADSTITARAHKYSDSLEGEVAKLQTRKQKIIVKVIADTAGVAAAESLLVAANSTSDSVKALKAEVSVLKDVNKTLWQAVAVADSQTVLERHRADTLLAKVDTLNVSVQKLTQKISALHGTPKWLRISFEALKVGGAAYAGYQIGKRH